MRMWQYVEQGGPIMYILLVMNILGLSLLLWRILTLLKARKSVDVMGKEISESLKLPDDYGVAMSLVKDEVQMRVHTYEFGLNTIKVIASISPLLGLLGTVMGILSAFHVIAEKGMSDPSLFAGGISMALITTVGGLIVAIPHFIGHYYLVGLLDDLEITLEKKTTLNIFTGAK